MSKQFNFKFNIGEKVFTLTTGTRSFFRECLSCDEGKVKLKNGKTLECPECKGKGLLVNKHEKVYVPVKMPMTIGQQAVEISTAKKADFDEKYMCDETGVGSGTCYKVDDLFTTYEEAKEEADRRNHDKTEWVCRECNPDKIIKEHYYYEKSEWFNCVIHGSTPHIMQSVLDKD